MSRKLSTSSVKRLVLAAAVGVGTLVVVPRVGAGPDANQPDQNQAAAQDQNNVNASRPLHLPDGFVEKNEDAVSGVKSTMVGLTQRAVTKDSYDSFFSGFLSELAARDKERAQEFKGVD